MPSRANGAGGLHAARAQPVRLAEDEGDEVTELHELGLGVVLTEPPPEVLAGAVGVVGDRLRPLERGPLAIREAGEVRDIGVVGEVAGVQLLHGAVDYSALEHGLARFRVALERGGQPCPDGVAVAHALSPALLRLSTSPWPIP